MIGKREHDQTETETETETETDRRMDADGDRKGQDFHIRKRAYKAL
jgi:hypothetical protein